MARNDTDVVDPVMEEAEQERRSLYPYDRRSMTYRRLRVNESGVATVTDRPVASTYEEALMTRKDYWHPGGAIFDKEGNQIGEHPAGWFVDGYKWRSDRPRVIENSLNLELGEGRVVIDDPDEVRRLSEQQR